MNLYPAVSELDKLKQVNYSLTWKQNINGVISQQTIPIDAGNVVDVQINWDSRTIWVDGYILFNDVNRITERLPNNVDILFKITASDSSWSPGNNARVTYEEDFIIAKQTRQITNNKNLNVKIEFVDKLYFRLANTYIGKGYNDVKSTDIISDIINNNTAPDTTSKTKNFFPSETTYENIVIPQNKPFASFIISKEFTDGFSFIQSRYSITTLSHTKLDSYLPVLYKDNLGVVFFYDESNTNISPYSIKTIKFLDADIFSFNVLLADTVVYQFNQDNMSSPSATLLNAGDLSSKIGDSSTLPKLGYNQGVRKREVLDINGMTNFFKYQLLESKLIEITVSGLFKYECLQKVGLELKSTIQGYKGNMPYVNGGYHILKIVDKFNGVNFNQVITLGRLGVENVINN